MKRKVYIDTSIPNFYHEVRAEPKTAAHLQLSHTVLNAGESDQP